MQVNNDDDLILTTKEKREFFHSFFIYYKSGIPIVDSVKKIFEKSKSPKIRFIAQNMYKELVRGASFDRVMKRYEISFGKVNTGLVVSGEKSGKLLAVLSRIQNLLQKENHIKNKVISAMTYPAIIFVMVIAVSCLFLFFVFPMFNGGGHINMAVQAMTALVKTAVVFTVFICILVYLKKIHFIDKTLIPSLVNIPKVGEVIKSANLANFFLVMSVAYDGGLSATEMLELAAETIKQPETRQKLRRSVKHLEAGKDISTALTLEDALPEEYIATIATGEMTGELDKSLGEIIDEIDESTELAISAFSQIIQPVMLIFAAIVVGALLFQCYSKMYSSLF
ncbi:type II secretion system F family protein [bacterium]|nr:type II secretion system F family protein [bacterium]